ncbi:MAG: NAD(P)/FAD-dependent oxidoreductase [Sorangiineae bacterium]|nr:NAD(P)/FAD-dependent oxidoreductase [Polyangiaceae bacterium]MEB2321653.1 NAD(P)/FAD-dependent oxidoreductase [Sorangiineae bacterium]
MTRVVVVGGGFGGLRVTTALRRAPVEVTLVDRSNHHLFQPLLYQIAMAGLSPADIAYPLRSALRAQQNATVLLGEVARVELERRVVELSDGERLAYDYLVIAAGAKTNFFGHDEWSGAALGLKSIDDAIEIRRRVLLAFEAAEREPDPEARKRLLTFAVIGGGPTGVEIAGALAELARTVMRRDFRHIDPSMTRVVLIEMQGRLLSGGFAPKLSDEARRELEELGVEVRLDTAVERIDDRGVSTATETIEAATVLWTAGVRARSVSSALGVELDRAGRIRVEADCSVPDHPEVFAIGDIACFVPDGGHAPLPGVAQVALQQGRFVARTIAAELRGAPRARFRYLDKGMMATIGRSRAVAQTWRGRVRLGGFVAWIAWLFIHIWYLIGFRNRVAVLANWAWAYFTYRRGARLITGEGAWRRLPELAARART